MRRVLAPLSSTLHRTGRVTASLAQLADVFTIYVWAYAVMGNYYHLVLRFDTEKAGNLGENDVIAQELAM